MHKAFPHQESLNGIDAKVLLISFTSVRVSGGKITRNDETTKHTKPKPQKEVKVVIIGKAVRRDMFGTEAKKSVSARRGLVCSWRSSDEMHKHILGSRICPKFQKVDRLSTALTIPCPWDLRSRFAITTFQ